MNLAPGGPRGRSREAHLCWWGWWGQNSALCTPGRSGQPASRREGGAAWAPMNRGTERPSRAAAANRERPPDSHLPWSRSTGAHLVELAERPSADPGRRAARDRERGGGVRRCHRRPTRRRSISTRSTGCWPPRARRWPSWPASSAVSGGAWWGRLSSLRTGAALLVLGTLITTAVLVPFVGLTFPSRGVTGEPERAMSLTVAALLTVAVARAADQHRGCWRCRHALGVVLAVHVSVRVGVRAPPLGALGRALRPPLSGRGDIAAHAVVTTLWVLLGAISIARGLRRARRGCGRGSD